MPNKITLPEAANIHIGELANLSAGQLLDLQIQAAEHLDKANRAKEWIDGAIGLKYQEQACNLRNINDKVTGIISFNDGDFKVSSNIDKKIEWDQLKLKEAVSEIKEFGDNPHDYIRISYEVAESKYNSWPEHIKKLVRPARLLKTTKEIFTIESKTKAIASHLKANSNNSNKGK